MRAIPIAAPRRAVSAMGLVVLGLVSLLGACVGGSSDVGPALDGDAELGRDADEETSPSDMAVVTFRVRAGEVANPDRGLYAFVDDLRLVSPDDLAAEYAAGVRLVYTPIRLDAHRDAALPESELALISEGMDRVREAGLGLIVRFAYNYPEDEDDYLDARDAPLDRVREHIAQLAPLVAAHADIITFWQAGFIGAWGEWHSSSSGLDTPAAKDSVRDALLEVLPPPVFLQLRYPPDLARALPSLPTEEGFAATARARLGFHNDCLLSSDTDVGTFEGGLEDPLRDFAAELAKTAPVGGETCDAEEETAPRTGCDAILGEGRRYGLTYLNRDYHTAFHDRWRRDGCFDEVVASLGYRLELRRLAHPQKAQSGGPLELEVTVVNTGWARPFALRHLVLELSSEGGAHRIATALDARRWTPGEHEDMAVVSLPALAPGRYQVAVGLPHEDPRRAIRFAVEADPSRAQVVRADGLVVTGTVIEIVGEGAPR